MNTQSMAHDKTGIVDVEGAQLRYRVEGSGPPCLVVGSSVLYPRVFSPELREHLQLIFIDLRHFADPRHPASADPSFRPEQITIDTYADDIDQVRQTLRLGDVVVIGHSVHGRFALEYARRYPEHVRGVVAISAVPCASDEYDAECGRLWEADASDDRKQILARQLAELTPEVRATLSPADMFVREYVAFGPMNFYDPAYDSSWLWEDVVPDMPIADVLFGKLFATYDLAQGSAEITVPVLIVHGRYDYNVPYTLWERRRHQLPRHSYALLDKSGHIPSLDEPQLFDQTLLAWIRGLDSPGG